MGFLGIKTRSEREMSAQIIDLQSRIENQSSELKAALEYSNITPIGSRVLPFDGEKNLGNIGPIISYVPDYYKLSTRAWQAYIETPLAKTVADKWVGWIIDQGLKLKANPARIVLESEGIQMTKQASEKFNDIVESRFDVWANSKHSSFTNEDTFAETTRSVYIGSKIGGDQLVVIRYINNTVKIQVIDGQRVKGQYLVNPESKNIISNGVEISVTGRTVGYWVCMPNTLAYEFIPAYSASTGLRTAFLVKGTRWRFDYHRGLPVVTTVLESLKKIERYQEASIASAEEVAKVAYQVIHQNFSDGSSPMLNQMAKTFGDGNIDDPVDALGQKLAENLAATTNKMAYNNPKGAKIETINQSNNLNGFETFYQTNAHIICSAIGIPPNVALSIYNDSFSASRAATKDWDHSMDVEREFFSAQYYNYIYKFWLYTEILKNKIQAPGYLSAFENGDFMVTESYERARFTGPHFPHINPLVEVQAERLKLGEAGKNIPLTTAELATEMLGTGDSDSNAVQFADELKTAETLGIKTEPKQVQQPQK